MDELVYRRDELNYLVISSGRIKLFRPDELLYRPDDIKKILYKALMGRRT